MKKTLVSIAAASLIVSSAMAADKGIDIVATGQAVVYYQSVATNGSGAADQDLFGTGAANAATGQVADNTRGNIGIQLNLDADLKNDFTFGSTINYLGSLGLEKNLVTGTMQSVNGANTAGVPENSIADDIYLSQLFIAKKLGNTTLKLGRQELPQSLSPFAYSEGWNVFTNTFDAALVINTDIPDTTLVGAYVSKTNGNGLGNNMSTFSDLSVNNNPVLGTPGLSAFGAAYMLTAQNKSLPMATITASYYDIATVGTAKGEGASILWGDVAIADKSLPMGLKLGVQGGSINPEASAFKDTSAYGVKVGLAPIENLTLCAAYTSVDDGSVAVRNTGGVKTPLYTQMILNQGAIASDNNTYMLKAAYNTGDFGTVILQGTQTSDESTGSINDNSDLTDIELVYKVKAGGVDFLAAYINQSWDKATTTTTVDGQQAVRVVARYNF
jgi:hypothetical protein